MSTNAKPLLAGWALKKSINASSPPALAPMPITGNGRRGGCSRSSGWARRSGSLSGGCGVSCWEWTCKFFPEGAAAVVWSAAGALAAPWAWSSFCPVPALDRKAGPDVLFRLPCSLADNEAPEQEKICATDRV